VGSLVLRAMNFAGADAAAAGVWTPATIQAALQALGVVQTTPAAQPATVQVPDLASQQAWVQAVEAHAGLAAQYQMAHAGQVAARARPQVVLPPGGGGASPYAAQEMRYKQIQKEHESQARQADLQAKRQDEVVIREQHRAALVVRKMIQRVRLATAETIDELRAELEQCQAEHMMAMGPVAEKVQQEAEKAMNDLQHKLNEEAERQIEEHRKQIEEEMNKREEEARVEAMAEEATLEVAEVETKVSHAEELAAPLTATGKESESPEGLLEAAIVTEESINSAQAELNLVAASLKEKWSGLGKNATGQAMLQKLGPHFRTLHARMAVSRRNLTKLQESTARTKATVGSKVQALRKERDQKEAFFRHDTDADGKLCREEVHAFALMECQIDLTNGQLDRLSSQLIGRDTGVTYQKLVQLQRMMVGFRGEAREQEKKDAEAKRVQELKEAMADFTAIADAAADLLAEVEAAEQSTGVIMKPLLSKNPQLDSQRLIDLVAAADEGLAPAAGKLDEALTRISEVDTAAKAEEGSREMIAAKKSEVVKLRSRARRIQDKLSRLQAAANQARSQSERRTFQELQRLRDGIVPAIRSQMASLGQSNEEFFNGICGDSGSMMQDQFVALLRNLPDPDIEFEDSQAGILFEHLAEGGSIVSLERFTTFLRFFFKVTKSTMLTKGLPINSQVVCRLEAGEILLLENGKSKDEKVGVTRIHCQSVAKKMSGWVTVSGNQGTAFLQPIALFCACVKEAPITDALKIQGSKTVRNLEVGEFVEALGPSEVDASCNVKRLHCKAKSDGLIGWVSIQGNAGTSFLEPC